MTDTTANAQRYLHLSESQRRALVLDVLSELGARNMSERGAEIWFSCLLPFGNHAHGDATPACSINYDKMVVNCFVCGGGGFSWWVASVKGFDSGTEARKWIAGTSELGDVEGLLPLAKLVEFLAELRHPHSTTYRAAIPHYDPRILDPWRFTHPYLTELRSIPEANVIAMQVGWNAEKSQITIPHFFRGKLVGWQARNLGNLGPDRPKYRSTPEFPKDQTLYNYDRAGLANSPVIVESPMSVIRHLHSRPNMLATFGAECPASQLDLMDRHGPPILWFDNDLAGWRATETAGEFLMARGIVLAVQCPYVGDPADLDDATFTEVLATQVVPLPLWRRPDPSTLLPLPTKELDMIRKTGTATPIIESEVVPPSDAPVSPSGPNDPARPDAPASSPTGPPPAAPPQDR